MSNVIDLSKERERRAHKEWSPGGFVIIDAEGKLVPHDGSFCGAFICDESSDGTLRCYRCDGDRSDEVE